MAALDALPARARGLRLTALLVLLVASILVPCLVLTGSLVWRVSVLDRERADREALALARTVSIQLDRELEEFTRLLAALATSPYLQDGQYREFHRQARELARDREVSVLLEQADGTPVLSTGLAWGAALPADGLSKSERAALESGRTEISDLLPGTAPQTWRVRIITPVRKSGALSYLISLSLDPRHFRQMLAATPRDPDWVLTLRDRAGRLIARSRAIGNFVGSQMDEWVSSAGQSGVQRTQIAGGKEVLRGYHRSQPSGWMAAAFVPTEVIEAPLRQLWSIIAILSSGMAAVVLPLAVFIGRQITEPISAAAAAASLLGRGTAITPVPSRLQEANALLQALAKSSTELTERSRALSANEARFRSVFEQSAVGFEQVDLNGRFIGINDRLCHLLGYTRDECMQKTFDAFTHPDDRAAETPLIEGLLEGRYPSYELEKRMITKSGDVIWVQVTSTLVRAEDGHAPYRTSVVEDITERRRSREAAARLAAIVQASPDVIISVSAGGVIETWNPAAETLFGHTESEAVGRPAEMIVAENRRAEFSRALVSARDGNNVVLETVCCSRSGTQIDVSASLAPISSDTNIGSISITMDDIRVRKRREAHILLLNRELAHRVKNTLAVIISIANQTLRASPQPAEFRVAFQGRLQALSAANDLLMQTSWTGADARDFVDKQLSALIPDGSRQLHKEGPAVRIPVEVSIPLGLALHELGTNAIKHGAWSVPFGQVRITWSLKSDPEMPHIRHLSLTWSERGGPPVAPPARRGFGSTLIDRGIPEATVRRTFEPEGFVCVIDIPIDVRDV